MVQSLIPCPEENNRAMGLLGTCGDDKQVMSLSVNGVALSHDKLDPHPSRQLALPLFSDFIPW